MAVTSYPKEKIKILLLEGIHQRAEESFRNAGYSNIERLTKALPEDQLIERMKDLHIIGIRSKTQITEKVVQAAERLMGVGCFCIGTNQVALDAATKAGITVFNSPFSNTRSVAELVISFSIMLIRRIPEMNKAIHDGVWQKDAKGSFELRGKTIGIIGYGHIGSQVSVLAESMGLKVIFYDIDPKLPLGNAEFEPSLDKLLQRSDVVTLHVPATQDTAYMIKKEQLDKMKEGGILLNLSRGNVVDLDALKEVLESGHLKGAAVDVFPKEPRSKGDDFESPLRGLPNVILTPHIGGSTMEAQANIGTEVSTKLINLMDTGATTGSQSVPALSLPVQSGTHRLLHTHKNVPGVLSKINSLLSDMNVNIVGQYLSTNPEIGYVVLDINKGASVEVLEQLKSIEGTIKARVLY